MLRDPEVHLDGEYAAVEAIRPDVRTVVTCGKVTDLSWARFSGLYPQRTRVLPHLQTFDTSGQGIVNGGQ